MKGLERTVETRQRQSAAAVSGPERLGLVVFAGDSVSSYSLPPAGDAVIGRSREADIHIAHDSLSRKHAALRVEAGQLEVKDLGSQNGTRVNGRAVGAQWQPLRVGDALQLGDATAVLQRTSSTRAHRRLWSHGYFEAQLEEECTRGSSPFVVVRVHVERPVTDASAAEALSRALNVSDCLGSYAPGEFEALLFGVDGEQAQERADDLIFALEALGLRARAGVACFPRDGRQAEQLLARACAEVADRGEAKVAATTGPVIASRAMKQLYAMIDRVAAGDITVLVQGETGVGKELVARAIHHRSARARKPYVAFNCAALAETLLESELFGHERGAFTGAETARAGLLESAQGGTVFLDEVGELPHSTQVKLLRVLEEKVVRRVGGSKARPLDVRFVAATNRDLEAEVKAGRFRSDLYFRLAGVCLMVPALRERVDEIEPLASSFIAASGKRNVSLSPAALAQLRAYAWPGNVRELRNAIERAMLLTDGKLIEPQALPLEKMAAVLLDATPASAPEPKHGDAAERTAIVEALASCAGNQTQAARRLGISRRTLLYRLDAYGLPRPVKKST